MKNRQTLITIVTAAVISALGIGGASFYQGNTFTDYSGKTVYSRAYNTIEALDRGDTAPWLVSAFANIETQIPGIGGLEKSFWAGNFRYPKAFWNKTELEKAIKAQTGAVSVDVQFFLNTQVLKQNEPDNTIIDENPGE